MFFQDACIPVVTTVLDKCLYGEKAVVSKVLDSGPNGEYPSKHDAVLRKFVSSHCAVSQFKMCMRNVQKERVLHGGVEGNGILIQIPTT